MKFFSELGSCWGGTMVSPAAEVAGGGRKTTEDQGGNCRTNGRETSKRVKPHGGAVRHWKPKLNIISEDSPMSEVDRGGVRHLAKKPPVKVKSRSSPAPPPSYEEEYWKSSYTMALPAFSPTSYLF